MNALHGLVLLSAAFGLVASSSARIEPSPPPPAHRVLVYTLSAGFEHDVVKRAKPDELSLVEQALVDLGRASGAFEAVPTRDASEFDPEKLARYDLVVFYTTGELPLTEAQCRSLLDFVKNGGAFAGVHCATDTFYAVPEYGEMVGAYFDGHPWHEKVRVKVEDREHVATKHLGESFEITDEIYQFKAPYERSKLHVLTSLDTTNLDTKRDGVHRTDGDFATSWTKDFGRGRVFYTGLGHRPEVWKDERFLRMLVGGFRWAMRDAGTATLSKSEAEYRAYALENTGDPKRGYELFRKPSGPMCIRCHKVNGTGADVGPDLSGIARDDSREQILESILAPSSTIEKGYEAVSIELTNGTQAFGRVLEEGDGMVKLADTNGEMRMIPASDIASRVTSNVSVMPQGLATTLSKPEFADLLSYLMTLKVPAVK